MTKVCLFKEYSGLEIPNLPYEFTVDRAAEFMPAGNAECMEIYETNVKVFEKDSVKRARIIEIFTNVGFVFITGELISKTKNGVLFDYPPCGDEQSSDDEKRHTPPVVPPPIEVVKCYDRLIFSSPRNELLANVNHQRAERGYPHLVQ